MTVRFVLVAIDDERPLGPQVRAALGVLSWKTVHSLAGGLYSLRHLKRLHDMSEISDRQTALVGEMVRPHELLRFPGGGNVMGGPSAPPFVPAPTPPAPDDSAAIAAANAERLADEKSIGRSATILTDYAQATQPAPVRSATLGAA